MTVIIRATRPNRLPPTTCTRVYTQEQPRSRKLAPPEPIEPAPVAAPLSEDAIALAWQAKARKEGHMRAGYSPGHVALYARQQADREELRRQRLRIVLHRLVEGPTPKLKLLALLGIHDGAMWSNIARMMREHGLADRALIVGKSTFTITDAGRAWLAETAPPAIAQHKVAAE